MGLLEGIEPTGEILKYDPPRGRVYVKEVIRDSAILFMPEGNPRERRIHRGRVLKVGAPARTAKGVEVLPAFSEGDEVYFVFEFLQKPRSFPDGVHVLAQEEVIGVIVGN